MRQPGGLGINDRRRGRCVGQSCMGHGPWAAVVGAVAVSSEAPRRVAGAARVERRAGAMRLRAEGTGWVRGWW